MKIFGLEFAPLFIPLERRIQTLVVSQWFFVTIAMPFVCWIFTVYSFFTSLLPLTALYIIWVYFFDWKTPKVGGRPIRRIRTLKMWNYFRDYFPISLVKTADLDPTKNYIFGYHPHGILVFSAFCNFCTEATGFSKLFPNIKLTSLTLETNFHCPFFREYLLALGLCDVSKESIRYLLNNCGVGNAILIVIGGAIEALDANPAIQCLTLKKRKGFVREAIKSGSYLVPCFGFHENELFNQVSNPRGSMLRKFQVVFKKWFHLSPPLFYGRGIFNYTFGMMPFRKSLVTVVGRPIPVEKVEDPPQELIDELHTKYLDALTALFEDNKEKYGIDSNSHLEFI